MLLEYRDARKLAEVLARKAAPKADRLFGFAKKRAERALANGGEVEPLFCGSVYGTRDPCPSEWGAAAKALNIMHMAVNGVKPYAEGGGGGGAPQGDPPSDGACVEAHEYDPIKCAEVSNDYTATTPEISGQTCDDEFACTGGFSCEKFICDHRFKGCVAESPSLFTCGNEVSMFEMGESPGHMCVGDEHHCPDANGQGVFHCPKNFHCRLWFNCNERTTPVFDCTDTFDCHIQFSCAHPMGAPIDCQQPFNCTDQFDCGEGFHCASHACGTSDDNDSDRFDCTLFGCANESASVFSCEDLYRCTPRGVGGFACAHSFGCGASSTPGDNVNGFACQDGEEAGFACAGSFDCEGIYHCENVYECANAFACPSSAGFSCMESLSSVFDCDTFQCSGTLDFVCHGAAQFACQGLNEFTCAGGHVFRCKEDFTCDSHTCSAGGTACDETHQFGGEGGPGVFSCDNEFGGCTQTVDCSEATVGYRCINKTPYDCGQPVAYNCGEKYDSCVISSQYDEFGNCDDPTPQDHGCSGNPPSSEGAYDCDVPTSYDCPATYELNCHHPDPFNRNADP